MTDGVGLPGTVGVAETGVCVVGRSVVGEAVTVEAVGDGWAAGVMEAVTGGVGDMAGTGDGDAVLRVGVTVGDAVGVGVGGVVGFAVVGIGVVTCAVADGCTVAALGVTVADVAAAA